MFLFQSSNGLQTNYCPVQFKNKDITKPTISDGSLRKHHQKKYRFKAEE
jgi:hypothetical protein